MCSGTGEIISRWTQELGGATLRCPKCLGSGRERRSSGLVKHTPLNCKCDDCNRRWAEWKRGSRPRRPRGVVDQAEDILEKYAAGRTRNERSGSGEPESPSSSSPGRRASQPPPKPKERRKRPERWRRRPQRKRRYRWLTWTLASILLITVAWALAYHQNVPAAVDAWRTSVSVYDGLMGSLLGGDLTGSDGAIGAPEPPPVIIVVTATPEPTPAVIVVTATPKPVPVSAPSTATPAQSSPPAKTSMTLPAATVTPTVVPTATPVRVVASPVPVVPSVTPTPTPVPPPNLRHLDHKQYMLELINAERLKAGVGTVVLGDNIAAQLHAEDGLVGCYSSHWGRDGLKPYMRYTLAGGYQSNGENGSGLDYCITSETRSPAGHRYSQLSSIRTEIREAMEGWMSSPGHRANILRPQHRKVNIGIAWDRYNMTAIQHFEGDYVEFDQLPSIKDGVLSISGTVKHGVHLGNSRDLSVMIFHDPPPHSLTRGQVSRTYCYDSGRPIAGLRPPLSGGRYYSEDEFTQSYSPCPDPYDVSADAPVPRSPEEGRSFWLEAYVASQAREPQDVTVAWITASEWIVGTEGFSVEANLQNLIERHGEGVYSIIAWGRIGDEDVAISQYSIFHGITPPHTYTP